MPAAAGPAPVLPRWRLHFLQHLSSTLCSPAARAWTVAAGSNSERQHSPAQPCGWPPPHWSSLELSGNLTQTLSNPHLGGILPGHFSGANPTPPEELFAALKGLGRLMGDWNLSSS